MRHAIVPVLVLLLFAAGGAHAAPTPAEKCAVAKLKAAAKKVATELACYTTATRKARVVDPACLAKAQDKFAAALAKAEAKGGCASIGEGSLLVTATEDYVGRVIGALPTRPVKYIFTAATSLAGHLGGLDGADGTCAARAAAGLLPGTYKAWLSSSTSSASQRLSHAAVPYVLPNGEKVADDFADLADGTLDHAIDRTETNQPAGLGPILTGTDESGSAAVGNCADWTSTESHLFATVGFPNQTTATWTNGTSLGCAPQQYRLYCLEQ